MSRPPAHDFDFGFDNTYWRDLEGFYAPASAAEVPAPRMLQLNRSLAASLGLDADALDSDLGAQILSGNAVPRGANPLAQAYAGHQFGGFVPQLGDGRALLLGEVVDPAGNRFDIQLKGSGRTRFSRGGDGKAPLGAVFREHLIAEAMHALGIPTTRALASVSTGETVRRETELPGAVLTRVAASHIRVGTFQFFAAHGNVDQVRQLADVSIARHHPHAADAENAYLALLEAMVDAQARLIAQWMAVGFVHGVMNTDNMTISGETIDYGPCAFIDEYRPDAVFSSIDRHGRYAYRNQPPIAVWNLARFAETLLPLIAADEDRAIELATQTVNGFMDRYDAHWLDRMRAKLGITTAEADDRELVDDLLDLLAHDAVDFTSAFRHLADGLEGEDPLRPLFASPDAYDRWRRRWRARHAEDALDAHRRAEAMNGVNPIYIPRNHKVEEALAAAVESNDLGPFETLLETLERPFEKRDGAEAFAQPAPSDFGPYRTFCGT